MDPILSQYIQDKSIPLERRKNMASDLDSGAIDEKTARGIIMQKYAGKYGGGVAGVGDKQPSLATSVGNLALKSAGQEQTAPDTTAPAPKYMMGGTNGSEMSLMNPSEVTPEKMKENIPKFGQPIKNQYYPQGYTPGAEFNTPGTETKGILPKAFGTSFDEYNMNNTQGEKGIIPSVLTDVYQSNNDGRGFSGAISGYNEEGKQLNTNERFQMGLQGLASVVKGTLGTALAVPGAAIETVIPQSQAFFNKMGGYLTDASKFVANGMAQYNDWDAETEKAMQMHLDNLFNLLTLEAGNKVVENMKLPAGFKNDVNVLKGKAGEAATVGLGYAKEGFNKGATAAEDLYNKGAATYRQARQTKYQEQVDNSVAQIIQGKTKDIAPARRALSEIDAENVKTYEDLSGTVADKVEAVARAQDQYLSQFPEAQPLSSFEKTAGSGKTAVTVNFVQDALMQLRELYTKARSPEDLARIIETTNKAEAEGLTIKEVNDIAREYNVDFGKKAFSKTGDPLTSANAQAYENTRSGIKEAYREKLPSNEAKLLDGKLGDLLETQKLVDKMAENVNKLKQKVQKRSLGEKAGRVVGAALNTLTMGSLKGLVEKFLSRGTGLKTLNALDLQQFLSKNLKTIDKLSQLIEKDPNAAMVEFKRLALPAPKEGVEYLPSTSTKPMEMTSRSQSTIDAAEQTRTQGQQFVKKATAPEQKLLPPPSSIQMGGKTYGNTPDMPTPAYKSPPQLYKDGGSMADIAGKARPKSRNISIRESSPLEKKVQKIAPTEVPLDKISTG